MLLKKKRKKTKQNNPTATSYNGRFHASHFLHRIKDPVNYNNRIFDRILPAIFFSIFNIANNDTFEKQ
jgi:hypothetical protein